MNKSPLLLVTSSLLFVSCGGTSSFSEPLSSPGSSEESVTSDQSVPSSQITSEESEDSGPLEPLTLEGLPLINSIEGKTLYVDSFGDSEYLFAETSATSFDLSFGLDAKTVTVKVNGGTSYIGYAGQKSDLTDDSFEWVIENVDTTYTALTCVDSKTGSNRFLMGRHQSYSYGEVSVDKYCLRAYAYSNMGTGSYADAPAYFMDAQDLGETIDSIAGKRARQRKYEAQCLHNLTYNKGDIDSGVISLLESWGVIK
ncbi:MAG: hypothetical protein MJ239_03155 [Bacilli bacterium]|nr:hypothetical protein [Bacilli bacterium]